MIVKRFLDFALASIGLLLLLPVFLVIAAWIKLDSNGPVFFRQQRIGRDGITFSIHKFRTMVTGAESFGPALTIGMDRRISRSGRFLRKYKLDELPQLIDVINGKMSLVGPRPEVPRYVAVYPEAVRHKVLSVRPGITDLASIEFRRENEILARAPDPEREYINHVLPVKLKLYVEYVERRSTLLDLVIILKTLRIILGK